MNNDKNRIARVATYARVSSQEQVIEGSSMDFQDSQLATYCQLQGWVIVNHYTDPGFSGKDGNRPGLERLRHDAKSGYFEKVVIWRLDRLARNLRLLLEIEAELREHDVSLFSMKEMVDTSTPIGRTVFQVLGLAAEWERESIAQRTQSGRLQRLKEGHWAVGPAPYGYNYDKDTKQLVINEEEAMIIRKIYELYSSGKSLNFIADHLNQGAFPPRGKNAKGWYATSLRQIMINPAYKGEAIVNRHCNIANINKVDLSNAIRITTTPIVSHDLWNVAQSRLVNNKHLKPTEDGLFTLQGLIRCGDCGRSYRADRFHGYRFYSCRGKLRQAHPDGSPRCTNKNIRAEYLEQAVWKRVTDIINDPNKLEPMLVEAINRLKERELELESRVLPIERRLRDIKEMKSRLADKWILENMDPVKYKVAQQNLDKEEARLMAARGETDSQQLAELELTKSLLTFWQNQVNSMAWNSEDETKEEHVMIRRIDEPHKTVLQLLGLNDTGLSELIQFPTSQRELFDKLQLRLVVFEDKIEVKALLPIPEISNQECTSMRGLGRGRYINYLINFNNDTF